MQTLFDFLGRLPVTQGQGAGTDLELQPWQRRFVRGAFAQGVDTAALSVGRGNGKTTLLAGVAASTLTGPLAQSRGETIIVASSLTQARIAFEHCLQFVKEDIDRDPQRWSVQDTAQRASITDKRTGARVRCISSDPRRAHGLAPVLALLDEPAQWPNNTGAKMLAAVVTGLGKIPGSRLVALGTRPADSGHWFNKMLDGGADYSQVHAAREKDSPFTLATMRRANPSLDFMPSLRKAIRADAARARIDASLLPSYLALRLNSGIEDSERAMLLEAGSWERCERSELPPVEGPLVLGVDLGSGAAMSAVAAYWPAVHRLEALAAFPAIPDLAARGRADNVGDLYGRMASRGELVTAGQRVVDVGELLQLALDRFGPPSVVVCDRFRENELRQALEAAAIPGCDLTVRGMGFKDGGQDVREFRRAVLDGRVKVLPSLLLRSALGGAIVVSDPAGNSKLAKQGQGGRRQHHRDDTAAAAILAISEGLRRASAPQVNPGELRILVV